MLVIDNTTPSGSEYQWEVHPKGGWDEFVAARHRVFERLQMESDLIRMMSDDDWRPARGPASGRDG